MKNIILALSILALAGCGNKHNEGEPVAPISSVPIPSVPLPPNNPNTVTESFHGSMCYEDTCFENKAGYEWARENKVTNPKKCEAQHEQSAYFQNGCIAYTIDPSDPPYDLNESEDEGGC